MQESNRDLAAPSDWQDAAAAAFARGNFRAARSLVAAHADDPAAQPWRARFAADPLIVGLSIACAILFLGIVVFTWVMR